MKLGFFAKFIGLLITGLIVVYVIDPLDPSTISTPFCLGLILMAISLRQSPSLVVAACVLYTLLTATALINFQHYNTSIGLYSPHPAFWLFQRTGLFLVVCAMSVYLALYRTAAERTRNHLQDILSKLPAPVAISDGSGFIVYANETMGAVLKQPAGAIIGRRYVEIFMSNIQEGKAMRYYIEIFSALDKSTQEIEVRFDQNSAPATARLICLGDGSNRVLITLLTSTNVTSREPQTAQAVV